MIHKVSLPSGQSKPADAAAAAAPAPVHVQQALMGKQMLDMVDGFGRAPLHVAAAAGRVDVVQQLLFGGCNYTKALQADFRYGAHSTTEEATGGTPLAVGQRCSLGVPSKEYICSRRHKALTASLFPSPVLK